MEEILQKARTSHTSPLAELAFLDTIMLPEVTYRYKETRIKILKDIHHKSRTKQLYNTQKSTKYSNTLKQKSIQEELQKLILA